MQGELISESLWGRESAAYWPLNSERNTGLSFKARITEGQNIQCWAVCEPALEFALASSMQPGHAVVWVVCPSP